MFNMLFEVILELQVVVHPAFRCPTCPTCPMSDAHVDQPLYLGVRHFTIPVLFQESKAETLVCHTSIGLRNLENLLVCEWSELDLPRIESWIAGIQSFGTIRCESSKQLAASPEVLYK